MTAKFKFEGVFLSLTYENPSENNMFPTGREVYTYG